MYKNDHGSWCWEEYFIPGYECHALNFRGHGGSPNSKSLRFTTIGNYVEDLTKVVDSMNTKPIFIAHSMGALVLQHYLSKNSASGAILLTPIPPWGVMKTTFKVAFSMPLSFLKANLLWTLHPIVNSVSKVQKAFFSENIDQSNLNKFASQVQSESYFAYLGMLLFALPKWKKINTKMLILGAEDDFLFSPKQMMGVAERYNSELVMFNGMGHDLMLDNGWENVADTINIWIQNELNSP
jgi:pimeloyl-ACP methyl ester carboxylesterase